MLSNNTADIKLTIVLIISLYFAGCKGENMNQEPDVSWLNDSYVCKTFDKSKYPRVEDKAIDIFNQALLLSRKARSSADHIKVAELYKKSADMGY